MSNANQPNKMMLWAGRVLSTLVMAPFVMSAAMKFSGSPELAQGMQHLGLPETLVPTLAVLEMLCIAFYIVPTTSVLGAILFTGYLGGAICTHLRVGEGVPLQITLGVLVWLGIYLREPRLRAILPLRH